MPRPRLAFVFVALVAACGGGSGGDGPSGGPGGGGGDEDLDPGRIPDLGPSVFEVHPPFGTPADGTRVVTLELRLISLLGRPIGGAEVMVEVSGCGNVLAGLPPTDVEGRTRGTLASFAGEVKTIVARTESGGRLTEFTPQRTEFLSIPERTYFVRTSGSDAHSGRSPLEAFRTIDQALAAAEEDATIHVGAGSYPGPIDFARGADPGAPLILAGDPSGSVTGDAGPVVIEAGGAERALLVRESRNVILRGLTFHGGLVGLELRDSSDVRVLDCRAYDNELGLLVSGGARVGVQDCRLTCNAIAAARVSSVDGFTFENNLVYGNLGDGLELRAGIAAGLVRYNTFFRNIGPHLREEESGGLGTIQGNLFVEGSAEAFLLQGVSGYSTGTNLVWANVLRGPSREPPGTIEGDPRFLDPHGSDGILGAEGAEDDDFRQGPESAALDLGAESASAVLLASHESLGMRTTRSDGELDGSRSDFPAANLGYHARAIASELASTSKGGARLVFQPPGSARSGCRDWKREEPQATRTRFGEVLEADLEFLELRLSPRETREELVAAQVNTGTEGRILVRRWDGRRLDPPEISPLVDNLPSAELGEKRFDLEYEALSGRAVLSWADAEGLPHFAVLAQGRWSPPRVVASAGAGRVRWVELVPRPGTDELALVTLDDERDLVVSLWDGTDFGEPVRLEPNTLVRRTWRPFDAAFESLSGDLLVSWGFSVFAEETRWATLERETSTWRSGQHPSTDASGAHVVLRADPSSDRIVGAFAEGDLDNDVSVSHWTGSEWIDTAELTLAGPIENRLLEIFWFGETGLAGVVFRRQGLDGSFNLALLQRTGWRIQPDVVLEGAQGSVGKAAQVLLRRVPGRSHLLGLVVDLDGRLFGLRHNGQRFLVLDEGTPYATGLDPASPRRSFDLALTAESSNVRIPD